MEQVNYDGGEMLEASKDVGGAKSAFLYMVYSSLVDSKPFAATMKGSSGLE